MIGLAGNASVSGTILSSCISSSDEIVSGLVTGLNELIDDELVGIYLDALYRLGLVPSPSGWGDGEEP